jgi:hypothetical protein
MAHRRRPRPTHLVALGQAEVRPVGHVRRDLAVFDRGSLTNRGLRSVLAFNHEGRVHLSCKSSRSSSGYPQLV